MTVSFSGQGDKPVTSKTGGGVWVGVDYSAKESVAVVMERQADGSWIVLDEVKGKGLDEVFGGTSTGQKSDAPFDTESDGR